MLKLETWLAGESGTNVSEPRLLGLVPKPLKKEKQKERFPPGSLDEEHALVLFDSCCRTVPTGTGLDPPVPPVRVGPDGVAVKDAVEK